MESTTLFIPLCGNSLWILSISSEGIGGFYLNLVALIQVSLEEFWHPHTWNLKFLHMSKLQLFIICKFLDMIWVWNLHWGYFLINKVGHWFYQLDHVTFSENGFWLVNFAVPFCRICYIQKSAMACLNVAIFTKKLYTL